MSIDKDLLIKALKQIVDKSGTDFFTKKKLLSSAYKDFLGGNRTELKHILGIINDTDVFKYLLEGMQTPTERLRLQSLIYRELEVERLMSAENSQFFLEMFCAALNWEMPTTQTAPEQPVRTHGEYIQLDDAALNWEMFTTQTAPEQPVRTHGKYIQLDEVMLPSMTVFFVVDTSDNMAGMKMRHLNETINNILPEIEEIADGNCNVEINIVVLKFSTDAEFVFLPTEIEKFNWRYLDTDDTANANLGLAYLKLNSELKKRRHPRSILAPIVFLFLGSSPTDDYHKAFNELNRTLKKWHAIKVAIPFGENVNMDILEEFTGSSENIVKTCVPEVLINFIRKGIFPKGISMGDDDWD
ncbi:hypothetical protein AGMMS49975_08220 [Clostridia bacterium]|nr:hypothetical protein AGMMS49975_08220 [Clostridia bacterium]